MYDVCTCGRALPIYWYCTFHSTATESFHLLHTSVPLANELRDDRLYVLDKYRILSLQSCSFVFIYGKGVSSMSSNI